MIDSYFSINSYIASGISPNLVIDGKPLILEALNYDSTKVLEVLLTRGANPNAVYEGKTMVYYVRSLKALKILLENGAYIPDGLFKYFVLNKPEAYADYLLTRNCDFNTLENIMVAINYGTPSLISKMADVGVDFLKKDKNLNYPLYYAKRSNIFLTVLNLGKYDLNAVNIYGENVLGMAYLNAVKRGQWDVVERLLELGVDKNYMAYGLNSKDIENMFLDK